MLCRGVVRVEYVCGVPCPNRACPEDVSYVYGMARGSVTSVLI